MSAADMGESYVVAERQRLSAAAILIIMLMVMVLLQSVMIFNMYQTINNLQNQITILNAQLRVLTPQVQALNQRYGSIDALLQIYIQQMVLRMYKEMFPNMTEEQLLELIREQMRIYQSRYNVTATNTTTGGFIIR